MMGKKTKVRDDIKTWNKRWQMFMFVVISTIVSFSVSLILYLLARFDVFHLESMLALSVILGILGVLVVIFGFIIVGYLLKMTKKDVKGYKKGKGKQEFSVMWGIQKTGISFKLGWFETVIALICVPVLITYVHATLSGVWKWFGIADAVLIVVLLAYVIRAFASKRQDVRIGPAKKTKRKPKSKPKKKVEKKVMKALFD